MRRELVTYPNPTLNIVAKPVEKVDDYIRKLLSDMVDTMYAEDGVGLAAPQIGVGLRVVVIDIGQRDGEENHGLLKMVNPEIVFSDGEIKWEEGCLSVPEFRKVMKRKKNLTVRYLDESGKPCELNAKGLFAIAVQQEMDHLNGILIIDSASHLKKDMYLKKRKKREEN